VKTRIASLSLLTIVCLLLAVAPAMADTYSNGPYNGTTNSWMINFGFSVTNSFSLTCLGGDGQCSLTSFSAVYWLTPGDTAPLVEAQVGSTPFGSDILDQVLHEDSTISLGTNQAGFVLEQNTYNFIGDDDINNGQTYWLTLLNASVPSGNPVYWDENSGPSSAFENTLGAIPSESFTITGIVSEGTTPEPSSILLLGSGILGLAGVLRRRLMG
jgi:PEP-CTERM motif